MRDPTPYRDAGSTGKLFEAMAGLPAFQTETQGLELLKMAAAQGDPSAMHWLGRRPGAGAGAASAEFRWRMHMSARVPGNWRGSYLSELTAFLEAPDRVAAHAVHNHARALDASAARRQSMGALEKDMSEARIREAVTLARTCHEAGYMPCLELVAARMQGRV